MQSVLIGFEYPVMDTLLFYFLKSSYCNLFRGVAECYAFSRFHDNVGLRDLPVIRHIESADAVVVDLDTLIGFPVSGSMPAVYRPSQRPSFRLRMLPSPFARFFAICVPLSVLVTQTTESAAVSIDETLQKMGLDYLDQMIIHFPQPWNEFRVEKRYFEENREVWRALEDAQAAGKVRVIGVSNFLQDDLESLFAGCRVRPMVNQILLHITNTDLALVDFCRKNNIQVEAYSPIAHGEALKNPAIVKMAEKYGVSAAQLCIRYAIQLGTVALPKTADPGHMKSNADVDFVISEEDMQTLLHMERIADYGAFNIFPVFSGKPLA